jgi:hypothetical protein
MAASERETQQRRIDSYRSVEGSRFDDDGGSYSFRPGGAWAGEGSAKELRGGKPAERLEGGSSRQRCGACWRSCWLMRRRARMCALSGASYPALPLVVLAQDEDGDAGSHATRGSHRMVQV